MPLTITKAPRSFKDQILALCRETYETHRAEAPQHWPGNFFEQIIAPPIEQAFIGPKGQNLAESETIFVALDGAQMAGYYRLSHLPKDPATEYFSVTVEDIYVLPEWRRQGVGQSLLRHAKGLAARHDWDALNAGVASWNRASQHLFEGEGFALHTQKYSFGPDRAARDIPPPQTRTEYRMTDWIWIALALLGLGALVALLTR